MGKTRWKRIDSAARVFIVVWVLLWLVQTVPLLVPRFIFPRFSRPSKMVAMETTGYCHCGKCCGYTDVLGVIPLQNGGEWWRWRLKRVGRTSSGKLTRYGTIAADPKVYPYGTVMYVPGYGYGVVLDVGGGVKGNHIDLYYPSHSMALLRGRRTVRVKVWLKK